MAERIAGSAVLVLLGLLLGVWGVALVGARLGPLPNVGVALSFVGNVAAAVAASVVLGRRDAALLPGLGWFVALFVLSAYHPGGDVLTPQTLATPEGLFMVLGFAGLLAPVLAETAWRRRAARRYTSAAEQPTDQRWTPSSD